jgi:hypothetical protein
MERVEGGCPRGGEEEGGGVAKGVEKVGAAATIGRRGGGRLGLGRGGSHPSDRDQRPEHALPSELPTPVGNAKRPTVSLKNAS